MRPKNFIFITIFHCLTSITLYADEGIKKGVSPQDDSNNRSFFIDTLLYFPNRIFDILDIVKAKVRVGPGVDIGLQLTKPVSLYVGAHTALYLGLPGPREESSIPIPFGAESVAGASLSLLDGTVHYDSTRGKEKAIKSETEISAELQLLLVGFEVGIDPVEILDALAGFILIDIRKDDL